MPVSDWFYSFIKYFTIQLCSLYAYAKLIGLRLPWKHGLLFLGYSLLSTPVVLLIRWQLPVLTIPVIILFTFSLTYLLYRRNASAGASLSVLTVAVTFGFFALSLFCTAPIQYLLFNLLRLSSQDVIAKLIGIVLICVVQFLLLFLMFRQKRFRSGLQGVERLLSGDVGILIAVFLVLITSLVYLLREPTLLPVVLSAVFALALLTIFMFSWRRKITNRYVFRSQSRTIEALESTLASVSAENTELSKLIHRDNKLLTALELAASSNPLLKNELTGLLKERSGLLTAYENTSLPEKTNIFAIDMMLQYVQSRAAAIGCTFLVHVQGDFQGLLNRESEVHDISTILSDLAENALIAMNGQEKKNLLVSLHSQDELFILSVLDNGALFPPQVLLSIGRSRRTTHKDEGGSGFGLMTVFELLHKNNASFELEEFSENTLYTKRISVAFDKKQELRVFSKRPELLDSYNFRGRVI